jgi:HlyD family secretion protein
MIMRNCRWFVTSGALSFLTVLASVAASVSALAQTAGRASASESRSQVHALARLEPTAGVVVIGARPGARIEKVAVAEGQDLKAGDLLAILEGHDQRARQLALAETQRDAARFQRKLQRDQLLLERDRFDRLKQPRLDSLRATVNDLRSKVGSSAEDHKQTADGKPKDAQEKPRAPGFGGGMVPAEMGTMLAAQLRTELAKTEIQLKELEVSNELLDRERKLEDERLAVNSPDLAVLDRQVELAQADLALAEVRAPAAGRVLAVLARAGEVSSGALLTMGDVRSMVARAEVFQTDVIDVAPGDSAEVSILGRTVAGEVTRVGTTVARNTVASLDPTALADRRVVEVVVRLADSALASRLVNMQVEVAIRKQSHRSASR